MRYNYDEMFLMIELALGKPPDPAPRSRGGSTIKVAITEDEYFHQLTRFVLALKPNIDGEELDIIRTTFYKKHDIWHFGYI